MKIQCDVCNKEEASVFCSVDEAALCGGCDRRVHHANKLAGKHIRFSLQRSPSSSKESPRCDICQEKRAILFCQEDRAILCRDCDIPIHKANEHTQKHSRFLLTGDRLSASSSSNGCDLATDSQIKCSVSKKLTKPSFKNKDPLPSASMHSRAYMDHCSSQENSVSDTSSISEYLMETLPGWQVDDFLDPSYKAIRVPEAPIEFCQTPLCLTQIGVINGLLKGSEEAQKAMKISRKWNEDGFTVPQISPPLKNSRHSS